MATSFDDEIELTALRERQSAKWTGYAPDVLPTWVAEMDFPLAEPIKRLLHALIDRGDTGYAAPRGFGQAFATFLKSEYTWSIAPKDVMAVADVMTGVRELLAVLTSPGDRVVINPPVYPPFFEAGKSARLEVCEAPLARRRDGDDDFWTLDLEAIERAYAASAERAGKTVHLLCSPHNPTGTVHSRATLEGLIALAERYDVTILSDEIHAPLTYVAEGAASPHIPLASLSEAASQRVIVLTSASKTWNLPGLKAAAMIATSDATRAVLRALPPETPWHAGHFGVLANEVALRECQPWRKRALYTLDRNRALLRALLTEHLPGVRYTPPAAGYLAWLDCSALGLGDDPGQAFLKRGRVALSNGPMFGAPGRGFARLNLATSRVLLEDAVLRMKSAL